MACHLGKDNPTLYRHVGYKSLKTVNVCIHKDVLNNYDLN